jgi:hypothetical protein
MICVSPDQKPHHNLRPAYLEYYFLPRAVSSRSPTRQRPKSLRRNRRSLPSGDRVRRAADSTLCATARGPAEGVAVALYHRFRRGAASTPPLPGACRHELQRKEPRRFKHAELRLAPHSPPRRSALGLRPSPCDRIAPGTRTLGARFCCRILDLYYSQSMPRLVP